MRTSWSNLGNVSRLIGVTALGVSAPALLAATAVLPSMLPAKAPPTKGKPQAQAAKAPVGAAKFKFAEALPTLLALAVLSARLELAISNTQPSHGSGD